MAITSMMSSESWKATPSASPNASRRSAVSASASDIRRAQPARGGDEGGGLAPDDLHVRLDRAVDAAGDLDLADLAVAQGGDGPRQQARHLGAELGRELGRPGEQVVAGQDRHRVVPPVVHRLDPAAVVGLVDDVVVVQRRQMGELHRDRRPHQAGVAGVAEVAGEQHEHRAEPLAAGVAAGTRPSRKRRRCRTARPSGASPRRRRGRGEAPSSSAGSGTCRPW